MSKDYDVSSISGSDNEDERDTSLHGRNREFGGISKNKIFMQLQNGERVSVWKCLLLNESERISFGSDKSLDMDVAGVMYLTPKVVIEKLKYVLHEPRDNSRLRIVLLSKGGHFAGCVFDGNSVVAHKTFHRLVPCFRKFFVELSEMFNRLASLANEKIDAIIINMIMHESHHFMNLCE